MDMTMHMTATATGTAAPAATGMDSMDMGMGMGGDGASCKISMLWNWYTVDTCFISSSWHNTSKGMFAGSCIGVVFLVMLLEFLRRASREYDRRLIRDVRNKHQNTIPREASRSNGSSIDNKNDTAQTATEAVSVEHSKIFRPSLVQQIVRAALHMCQFTVAYFIMLLAMYYNGYIIICIIIGAFLGSFVFSWETLKLDSDEKKEATFCCG